LNTANDFTGGSALNSGRVRIGNANGLGAGNITFASGALSSIGAAALTVTNRMVITGSAVLGNSTDNGVLTLSGPVDFNGGAPGIDAQSDVVVTGVLTNGGLGSKSGPGTLTLKGGDNESGGTWNILNGVLKVDGISLVRPTASIQVAGALANGVARCVITNGAAVTISNATPVRLGVQGISSNTSSNYLDLSGTLRFETNVNAVIQLGQASTYAELNLFPGSLLRVGGVAYFASAGNSTVVNINGATIAASGSNTNFMSGHTAVNIRSGGITLDTESSSITIAQALLDGSGGGGLTKNGNGTLSLNGVNTYTGLTLVNSGSLGGTGVINGSLTVAVGGTLAPGNSLGTLTVNQNFTNVGTAFMELDASTLAANQVVGLVNASYGGSLVVSNVTGTALAAGQVYQLFTASGAKTGNFSAITLLGAGASGLAGTFNSTNGQLTLASGVVSQPVINQFSVSGGNLILQGTNGTPSTTYSLITATNLTIPRANWTTNTTGTFGGGGTFSNGIPVGTDAARFFQIKTP
jgi:fibronectin-binding autotransporter adhesin